jgi:NAD(P)H dehydrogenase (quinone)
MAQILIIYTTLRGNTGKMVEPVAEGVRSEGVEARVLPVEQVAMADMRAAQGIIIGSPTRFGVDWQIKRLFDTVTIEGYPGPLEGKVGGAFTAGGRAGSGAELTLLNALHLLLNHGCIIVSILASPAGPALPCILWAGVFQHQLAIFGGNDHLSATLQLAK